MNTITRADLTEAVQQALGLSKQEAAELVETVFALVVETLVKGEEVKISGFGTFEPRKKAARMGRNPRTKEDVPIPPRTVVVFKSSPVLRDSVNANSQAN